MTRRSPGALGFKRGEPPVFTVDLSLDRLALDPWLPSHLPGLADLSRPVSGLDAELRLNIRHATLAGSTIEGLAVEAAIEAGNILLRRVEGTARGAHVVASGYAGRRRQAERRQAQRSRHTMRHCWPTCCPLRGERPRRCGMGRRNWMCRLAGPPEALAAACPAGAGRCAVGGAPDDRPAIGRMEHDAHSAPSGRASAGRDARLAGAAGPARACLPGWATVRCRWWRISPVGQVGSPRTSSTSPRRRCMPAAIWPSTEAAPRRMCRVMSIPMQ